MVKTHTRKWKEKHFQELKSLLSDSNVKSIAIVSLHNCPAFLLQKARKELKDSNIKVVKRRVLLKVFEDLKNNIENIEELSKHAEGQIALITSSLDSFELFRQLKKIKAEMPAKPGIVAEKDIYVYAGSTNIPAGPALAELKQLGIKASIKGPTISIDEDKLLVKKGEIITEKIASVLSKLDIKPLEARLKMLACLESGTLFLPDVLDIDAEEYYNNIVKAYLDSLALSIEIGFVTKDNVQLLISKAYGESIAVALEAGIINKETLPLLISKAMNYANAVNNLLPKEKQEENNA